MFRNLNHSLTAKLTAAALGAIASLALVTPTFASSATGTGTGAVAAHGTGTAVVTGDVDKMGVSGVGTLVVVDHGGDAHVKVAGRGVKHTVASNGVTTTTYAGFNGSATISGSDVTVRLAGVNVRLAAAGDGSFTLKGAGVYDTNPGAAGGEGTWSTNGITGSI